MFVPRLDRLQRQRADLAEIVAALNDKTLEELHRRAQHPVADAYGAGRPEANVTASSPDTPVEAAVLAEAGGGDDDPDTWESPPDPTLEVLGELFAGMAEALGILRAVDRRRAYLLALGPGAGDGEARRKLRAGEGECRCCERVVTGTPNDRLKSGYCPACWTAYCRDGKPGSDPQAPGLGRRRWERERRSNLEARRAS